MNPYHDGAICAKCRHDKISTRHLPANRVIVFGSFFDTEEVMKRCCQRCGYSWGEMPLDRDQDIWPEAVERINGEDPDMVVQL